MPDRLPHPDDPALQTGPPRFYRSCTRHVGFGLQHRMQRLLLTDQQTALTRRLVDQRHIRYHFLQMLILNSG